LLVVLNEVAAGGAAKAVGHATHSGTVDVHHVLLVAAGIHRVLTLEDQPGPVGAEVGLGVVTAEGELTNVGEVGFAFHRLVEHFRCRSAVVGRSLLGGGSTRSHQHRGYCNRAPNGADPFIELVSSSIR